LWINLFSFVEHVVDGLLDVTFGIPFADDGLLDLITYCVCPFGPTRLTKRTFGFDIHSFLRKHHTLPFGGRPRGFPNGDGEDPSLIQLRVVSHHTLPFGGCPCGFPNGDGQKEISGCTDDDLLVRIVNVGILRVVLFFYFKKKSK